jgi:hypothetical protein
MSVGSLVLGLIDGILVGLLAVGLVLVYRSNRFLNLAHAQIGGGCTPGVPAAPAAGLPLVHQRQPVPPRR